MPQSTEPSSDGGFAHGADTLVDVLNEAKQHGYRSAFRVKADAVATCGSCNTSSPASTFAVDHYRRLEGASDAADLMLVALVRCPECDAAGAITLGYGPNAGEHDDAFLQALDLSNASSGPDS